MCNAFEVGQRRGNGLIGRIGCDGLRMWRLASEDEGRLTGVNVSVDEDYKIL